MAGYFWQSRHNKFHLATARYKLDVQSRGTLRAHAGGMCCRVLTGTPPRPKMPKTMGAALHVGQVLGHYRLLERLGEGGMGVVWRAEDTRLQRQIALKFLLADAAHDSARRQRFEQEARAAAALSHPRIATVHELTGADDQIFIVFEFMPGTTLRTSIVPGGIPTEELLDIAADIADALVAAH